MFSYLGQQSRAMESVKKRCRSVYRQVGMGEMKGKVCNTGETSDAVWSRDSGSEAEQEFAEMKMLRFSWGVTRMDRIRNNQRDNAC